MAEQKTNGPSPREAGLVKMSELSRRSGVPAPTIKHYIREGLLPGPQVRTSRNMAWYDPQMVVRIKAIKELQRTRHLPLSDIRRVLDGASPAPDARSDARVAAAIARVLAETVEPEVMTREQLVAYGVPAHELDGLEKLGIVKLDEGGAYRGHDLAVLRILRDARRSGLDANMLPFSLLGEYAVAVQRLVRFELEAFERGVIPNAGDNLDALAETATRLSERLVVLMRRRLLIPTLEQLFADERARRDSKGP